VSYFYLTINTGHFECCDTPLATLPRSSFLKPPNPRDPITVKSTSCDSVYDIKDSVIDMTSNKALICHMAPLCALSCDSLSIRSFKRFSVLQFETLFYYEH
jgi:hypothetical protein